MIYLSVNGPLSARGSGEKDIDVDIHCKTFFDFFHTLQI